MGIWKEIEKKLKEDLSHKRYVHSEGVRYTAACLAMRYGCDVEKAMLAGLLHDCAKHLTEEQLEEECRRNQIPISEGESRNLHLLHAKVGAHMAKTRYGVESEEVLGAIRHHVTGRPEMSPLEEVVFVADYIEPNRKMMYGLDEARGEAFHNLERAIAIISENVIRYQEEVEFLDHVDKREYGRSIVDFYSKK